MWCFREGVVHWDICLTNSRAASPACALVWSGPQEILQNAIDSCYLPRKKSSYMEMLNQQVTGVLLIMFNHPFKGVSANSGFVQWFFSGAYVSKRMHFTSISLTVNESKRSFFFFYERSLGGAAVSKPHGMTEAKLGQTISQTKTWNQADCESTVFHNVVAQESNSGDLQWPMNHYRRISPCCGSAYIHTLAAGGWNIF